MSLGLLFGHHESSLTKYVIALQAVYSHGYITTNSVIGPATASIYANELNLFNLRIDLAAQKLVLATSNQTIVAERTE